MTIEPTSQFAQAIENNYQVSGRVGAGAGVVGGLVGGGFASMLLASGSLKVAVPAALVTTAFVALVGRALGRKAAPALTRGASPYLVGLGVAFAATLAMGLFLGVLAALGLRGTHESPIAMVGIMVFYTLLFGAVPSVVLGLVFGALVSRKRQLGG